MIVMLDYQHNTVRQRKRGERWRAEREAEEKRVEERGWGRVEVMMWQRQKGLEEFHCKGPNIQVFS